MKKLLVISFDILPKEEKQIVFNLLPPLPMSISANLAMHLPNKVGISEEETEWIDLCHEGEAEIPLLKDRIAKIVKKGIEVKELLVESKIVQELKMTAQRFAQILFPDKNVRVLEINSEKPDYQEITNFFRSTA